METPPLSEFLTDLAARLEVNPTFSEEEAAQVAHDLRNYAWGEMNQEELIRSNKELTLTNRELTQKAKGKR